MLIREAFLFVVNNYYLHSLKQNKKLSIMYVNFKSAERVDFMKIIGIKDNISNRLSLSVVSREKGVTRVKFELENLDPLSEVLYLEGNEKYNLEIKSITFYMNVAYISGEYNRPENEKYNYYPKGIDWAHFLKK